MIAWQWVVMILLALILVGGSVWASFGDADRWVLWGLCGILPILLAGFFVVAIPTWNADQARWEQWCHAQGGHVTDSTTTTTVVTVGANGNPGVGTGSSTTYFCLSANGRILDIRS